MQVEPDGRCTINVLLPSGMIQTVTPSDVLWCAATRTIQFMLNQQLYTYRIAILPDGQSAASSQQKQQLIVASDQLNARIVGLNAAVYDAKIGGATAMAHADQGVVKSPLAGRVIRILVTQGQLVLPGQALLSIESMKMENELSAPSGGYIKTILINQGDVVQQKQIVITLSSEGEGHAAQRSEHESASVSYRGPG